METLIVSQCAQPLRSLISMLTASPSSRARAMLQGHLWLSLWHPHKAGDRSLLPSWVAWGAALQEAGCLPKFLRGPPLGLPRGGGGGGGGRRGAGGGGGGGGNGGGGGGGGGGVGNVQAELADVSCSRAQVAGLCFWLCCRSVTLAELLWVSLAQGGALPSGPL